MKSLRSAKLVHKLAILSKKINGVNVKTLDGLITVLRGKRAGDTVEIEILRNSQTITLVLELDLRPSDV